MDFAAAAIWALFLSASWACIYAIARARGRNAIPNLPPGPSPLPVLGNLLHLLSGRPNESLADLAKKHGPVMTLRLGSSFAVVVSSAAIAREAFQKNDRALAGRLPGEAVRSLDYHRYSIGWLPAESHWRRLRTLCNASMFSAPKLSADQRIRRHKIQELLAYVRRSCLHRHAVAIRHAAFVTVMNTLSAAILSADLLDFDSDSSGSLKEAVHGVMDDATKPNVADYFPALRWVDPQRMRKRATAHFRNFYAILDNVIEERLLRGASVDDLQPRKNDFLEHLLQESEEKGSEFSGLNIKPLVMELLMAGTHTVSLTVEWIMAELVRHPKVLSRARSEIKDAVDGAGHALEESQAAKLPYLQALIKETLRLHPTAPLLIPHKAEATVEIGGHTVPQNALVIFNAWAIGRDPAAWENPTSFQPERFLGTDINLMGTNYDLIPFGSGRRTCPGMPFALRLLPLMVASLLHSFSWKLPHGMAPEDVNMDYKLGMNMQLIAPLLLVPVED